MLPKALQVHHQIVQIFRLMLMMDFFLEKVFQESKSYFGCSKYPQRLKLTVVYPKFEFPPAKSAYFPTELAAIESLGRDNVVKVHVLLSLIQMSTV